jgi:hypothetical protein
MASTEKGAASFTRLLGSAEPTSRALIGNRHVQPTDAALRSFAAFVLEGNLDLRPIGLDLAILQLHVEL